MNTLGRTCVGLAVVCGAAMTQPQFTFRGDRFHPMKWEEMNGAQQTMVTDLLSGDRGGVGGPFNVLLRSPEMGNLAQKFGASMRYHSSMPSPLNEMAIIMTAREWTSQYEWYAHKRAALQAGLPQAIVDAIAKGQRPATMTNDERIAYDFCSELLKKHEVSDATFKATKDRFGERGVVDLIGVMGYYHLVAMALNVDRYPMPDGVKPELQPIP